MWTLFLGGWHPIFTRRHHPETVSTLDLSHSKCLKSSIFVITNMKNTQKNFKCFYNLKSHIPSLLLVIELKMLTFVSVMLSLLHSKNSGIVTAVRQIVP
jgi:hypothetical protein